MAKDITTKYFNKNVYDLTNVDETGELKFLGKNPVVVDFHAPWCGPCRVLEPIIDELNEEYDNVDFYKVDTEAEIGLAASFGVRSLPTLLFIPMEGKPMILPGAPRKQFLKEMIDEKLFGKEVEKDENLDDKVDTFNQLMEKIRAVLK